MLITTSFSPDEFLAAATNLSSSTATSPEKVAHSSLKHLFRSGMDILLYIFNLSWSWHSFSSIWKTSSIFPIQMEKPLDSPASLDGLLWIKFCSFLSPFWLGLTNSGRVLGRFSLQSTSQKLSTLSGTRLFHKLILICSSFFC